MIHLTTIEDSPKPTNSTSSAATSTITTSAVVTNTPTVATGPTFGEDMNTESIMTAIAFVQKVENANALKDITTVQKMMTRNVTKTLSDQAHNILCNDRGEERTNEAVIGHILDEAVLTVHIRDFNE